MLSPNDFVARWGQDSKLLRYSVKGVGELALSDADREFLVQAGLPEDAAPFLSFQAPGQLPTVAEAWGQPAEFRRYRIIGFDGAGNPIALDDNSQGEVVCLDHEDRFARVFMNRSVRQLAASLLAFRKLVKDTQAEFGPDAFLDGKTSSAARAELKQALMAIDPAALQPGCFWHGEVQNLEANAG